MSSATLEQPQQLHELNGMRFVASKVTMVSIFPIACVAMRNFGPNITGAVNQKYVLPAAVKGSYSKLDVYDSFERLQDFNQMTIVGKPVFTPSPVPARLIAQDFFKEWVENRLGCDGSIRPGIAIIDTPEPSKELLASLTAVQSEYAKKLFHDAGEHHQKHNWRDITELHRSLARWANLKAPWVEDEESSRQEMKKCTECLQTIPAKANVCFICRSPQAKAA